jgi:sulfite exporter TauE/SafE
MIEVTLLSVFLLGLLGGVHCAGMCGGIVSVIGAGAASRPASGPTIAIPVVAHRSARALPKLLAYNAGRVATYTLIGTLAGALGSAATLATGLLAVQQSMFVAANLLLIVLGLYLTGVLNALTALEQAGAGLWRRLRPLATRLLGAHGTGGAFATGLVWGLVPCGMVYGVLIAALLSGSAAQGGALMLAFGLGTLPNLLTLGWMANRGRHLLQRPPLRLLGGVLVIGFGIAGLLRLDPGEHLHAVVDACVNLFR